MCGDRDVRVHADTADARAALAWENREIVGVDAVAHAEHTLAAAGTRCDAARDRGGVERREQRLLRCQCVVLGRCVVAETATLEQTRKAPRHLPCDALHLGVVGWWERVEAQRSALGSGVDTVEYQRVEVDVEVERIAEALHEGDGAAVPTRDRPLPPGAAPQRAEHGLHEDREHVAHERRVVGKPVAQCEGQREHPLAHGDLGQHAIGQMCGGVGHPAAAARGTETAALAREGDDAIETTAVAVNAQESVGKDPAAQEGAKLARDEAGHRSFACMRASKEGLEFLLHQLVEAARFGLAARVAPPVDDVRIARCAGGRGRAGAHTRVDLPASCRARGEPFSLHLLADTRKPDARARCGRHPEFT